MATDENRMFYEEVRQESNHTDRKFDSRSIMVTSRQATGLMLYKTLAVAETFHAQMLDQFHLVFVIGMNGTSCGKSSSVLRHTFRP